LAYLRQISPTSFSSGRELTKNLIAIGFNLEGRGNPSVNIEETIVAASLESIVRKDYRVLSLLIQWIETHSPFVLVDRLGKLASEIPHKKVRLFWCAVGQSLQGRDNRYLKLSKLFNKPKKTNILAIDVEFQKKRYGSYEFFDGTCIKIPKNFVRNRPQDILSVSKLAKIHGVYKNRVVMGASYRADLWATLEAERGKITATELARGAYCSYRSAWLAKEHFKMLNSA